MRWKNTKDHYGHISIGLHWLMFLLIVAVYACIELREFYPKGSDPREALKSWHFMLGLTVFFIVWLRLIMRLGQIVPEIKPMLSPGQQRLAFFVHIILYGFMIIMPVLGWLLLSSEGKIIPFYGAELPALISENKVLGEWIEEVHEIIGSVGYVLIGLHAVAALVHHYFQKDNTLLRMLPRKR